ncbi:hypothetical protein D3C79_857250 [compost metagenome]
MPHDYERNDALYPFGATQNTGDNDFCTSKQLLAEIKYCNMGKAEPPLQTAINRSRVSCIVLANKKPAYSQQQTKPKRHRQLPQTLKKTATDLQLPDLLRCNLAWNNVLFIPLTPSHAKAK